MQHTSQEIVFCVVRDIPIRNRRKITIFLAYMQINQQENDKKNALLFVATWDKTLLQQCLLRDMSLGQGSNSHGTKSAG